jgi:dCTP deaminase
MIMPDSWIRQQAIVHEMIDPFCDRQVRTVNDEPGGRRIISYGVSSYGYDARVGTKFKVFSNAFSAVVDPKGFDDKAFVEIEVEPHEPCLIPPNSFALASTIERFKIPRDVLAVCVGKSTYARCGIIVNVTPLEPEWEGQVTLEFSNTTPLPAKIYACEGACQFLFYKGSEPPTVSYKDRSGKYMGQRGIVGPRV